jgi:hypothetical protein
MLMCYLLVREDYQENDVCFIIFGKQETLPLVKDNARHYVNIQVYSCLCS